MHITVLMLVHISPTCTLELSCAYACACLTSVSQALRLTIWVLKLVVPGRKTDRYYRKSLDEKQERERLNVSQCSPARLMLHGNHFVFITHNFNILFSLHALNEFQVERLRVILHAISRLLYVITRIFVYLIVICV